MSANYHREIAYPPPNQYPSLQQYLPLRHQTTDMPIMAEWNLKGRPAGSSDHWGTGLQSVPVPFLPAPQISDAVPLPLRINSMYAYGAPQRSASMRW